MSIKLDLSLTHKFLDEKEFATLRIKADTAYNGLSKLGMTGWMSPSLDSIDEVESLAGQLRDKSDFIISIGIGGSYLGAKAVIEALVPHSASKVLFAGQDLSATNLQRITDRVKDKNFSIIIISKSGNTLEPAIAARHFLKILQDKYGPEEANSRVVAITGENTGVLRTLATTYNWRTLPIEDNVGGRYSVLTNAQLLTIASAGVNIRELVAGANAAAQDESFIANAKNYAVTRNLLYKSGKEIGIFSTFEPSLHYLAEWWKQLYGESGGKEGIGVFPVSTTFTTDLHSLGQIIQDGRRNIFEGFIRIEKSSSDIELIQVEYDEGKLNYLAGKTMNQINNIALQATKQAHFDGGVPVIEVSIPELNAQNLGALIYFFELSIAISALLLGINPFDQPGVEAYKLNMYTLLERKQ